MNLSHNAGCSDWGKLEKFLSFKILLYLEEVRTQNHSIRRNHFVTHLSL